MAFAREFAGTAGAAGAAEGAEAVGLAVPHTPHLSAPAGFTNVHTGQAHPAGGAGRAGVFVGGLLSRFSRFFLSKAPLQFTPLFVRIFLSCLIVGFAAPHAPHTTAPSAFTSVHTGQVQGILLIYTD